MSTRIDALQQVRERRFLIDRVDAWIYKEIMPYLGQRVLEVGCGLGNLMRHFVDRELVVGIDVDPESIEHVRQLYTEKRNVKAFPMDICDPRVLELGSYHFDTVVSLNVLEHIEDDLLALRHIREVLTPGGHLVLIVPAHPGLYGSMDSALGHFRRYTKLMMSDKLKQKDFVPMVRKYVNVLGSLGWYVNGRVLKKEGPPSGQLRVFNHVAPLLQTIERRLPPPFGLSLLTVAK